MQVQNNIVHGTKLNHLQVLQPNHQEQEDTIQYSHQQVPTPVLDFRPRAQIPNASPTNTSTQDVVLQAFMTKLKENNVQTERTEDRRRMLDKLDTFYGDDRVQMSPMDQHGRANSKML